MPGDPPPHRQDDPEPPDRPVGPAPSRPGPTGEQLLSGVSRAAWRSMTWPLEASRLLRPGSSMSSGWRDSWLKATRWWADALTTGARLAPGASDTLLAELAGGLVRAFRGRRVRVEVGGRSVRAVLDSIWLERHDGGYGGRIELRSVDWDGLEVKEVSMIANDLGLATQPDVALIMSGVELRGRSALEPVVAWLGPQLPEWSLRAGEDGLIEAVRRSGGRRYLVHAAIRDGEAEVELRAVRLRRATVSLPRWLRLTRRLVLPPLPGGMSVAEARNLEDGVEFRLSVPAVRQRFDLGRVRQAILSAASLGSD